MLKVYTDGACEPNPGPGGWAFVVYRDGVEEQHFVGGDPTATNNTMEMTAVLEALRWLHVNEDAEICSDSQYVVKGCNEWRHNWKRNGWRRKPRRGSVGSGELANLELWKALDAALNSKPRVKIVWCRGHVGEIGNERADELASEACVAHGGVFVDRDRFRVA